MLTKILNFHAPGSARGRLLRLLALFFSFLYLFSPPLQAQQGSPALKNLVEKLKKNVIRITAVFPDGQERYGFGFVTGEKDGKLYLVTAGHVVHREVGENTKSIQDTKSIQVEIFNKPGSFIAKEAQWFESPDDDLSLLVMDAVPGYQWEKNCLGKDPQEYDEVRFIGRATEWVSPNVGEVRSPKDPNHVEFTINTVAPGTSGAPLVGKNGIIGMVTRDSDNPSVALSISRIRALIGGANYPFSASYFHAGPIDSVMALVAGGPFIMGCTSEQGSDCWPAGRPPHSVTVSDFYIGKYEVTQKEWREVMGKDPSSFKNCDNCPVENVSWDDIQEFLVKLNKKTGDTYRLPTEAEWEYAARGGALSEGYKYSGSNSEDEVSWHYGNSGKKTHPVGQKRPNELGLYDMTGNVWEWCADDWHDSYTGAPSTGQVWIDSPRVKERVNRGGSWDTRSPQYLRLPTRNHNMSSNRASGLGFRLALSK